MTQPLTLDDHRARSSGARHPALRGGVLAMLSFGCPQLLDDGFSASVAEAGATANAGSGAGSAAGSGGSGAAGTSATGGAASSGGSATNGSGGSGGAAGAAGNGGSGATTGATGCQFGDFSTPELITGLGRSDALYGPSLAGNGLVLAFSESIADGPEDIYFSQRSGPGAAFGVAAPATGINTSDAEGTASLAGDALTLYFFSDRSGGPGGRDIYRATRADVRDDFAGVRPLDGINGDSDDHMPWVSPDERTLYFASNREAPDASGNIWVAQRSSPADGFEPPSELPGINSDDRDISPSLTTDQRILFFCSDRAGGAGSDDIWMATREDVASEFGAPQPVPIVNDTSSELNVAISGDGLEIVFSSNRSGGRRLFRSVRSCL